MRTNLDNNNVKDNVKRKKKSILKSKNTKIAIIVVSCGLLAAIIGGVFYVKTTVSNYADRIYPGMKVQGIDLSGKTKEEAIKIIEDDYKKNIQNKKIVITAGDKQYNINYGDLNLKFNIDETVNNVLKEGKDKSTFEKFKMIKNNASKEHEIKFTYDTNVIDNNINVIASELNKPKVEATISKSGSGFNITPEQMGSKLDTKALKDEIIKKISESKLEEKEIKVNGKLIEEKPKITKEELQKINTLISTFSTSYAGSTIDRATNIEIGTRAVDGTVLMPGDSFSFNTIVGNTTPDKGYMEGVVIVGDKLEKDYGGGICQVSSTLHNAVLRMGILPDSRLNHNLPVSYVPLGLDATIAYGGIDYVFTNSTKYPIYIEGLAGGGNVTFNIYSNAAEKTSKTYDFTSETYATIPSETKYEDDPSLPAGTEVVAQGGTTGCKVKAYRITYDNGVEVNRELINNDTYAPMPTIIKRGTGKVAVSDQTKTEKPKQEQPKQDKPKQDNPKQDKPKEETPKPNAEKPNN